MGGLRSPYLFLLLSVLFAVFGCRGDGDAGEGGAAPEGATQLGDIIADPQSTLLRMRAVGPEGAVPAELVIQLRKPLFAGVEAGTVLGEGSRLDFDPPVPGHLEVLSADTLRFLPDTGFRPDTAYRATLAAVEGGGQRATPPDGESWSLPFRTPPFQLLRGGLTERDAAAGRVTVELYFSAPVDVNEVKARARWSLGALQLRPTAEAAGSRPSSVRFTFEDPALRGDGLLSVSVEPVPSAQDAALQAPAASFELSLTRGPEVEILSFGVREGQNGHYLEVVCNDKGAGGERYYWDPETYDGWWTSRRCILDEAEARRVVHIDPAVEFTVAEAPAGFRLFGDFPIGEYSLRIDGGARTRDGGVLGSGYSGQVRVPERKPRISFASKGRYLPRSAWKKLAVQHLNVDAVTVTVRHVPEANLAFWLSGDRETADARSSNVVAKQELTFSRVTDLEETAWVDVSAVLPKVQRGVYELRVDTKADPANPGRATTGDAARILLTDMQLVAKRASPRPGQAWSPSVLVWALDTHSGAPLTGVHVKLIRPSGQAMATCDTGMSGVCEIKVPMDEVDPTPPLALVATRDDDLTYLKFEELRLDPEADVAGRPYAIDAEAAAAYQAALYTDRGVYRPGDVAHLGGVLRDPSFHAPEAALPVVVQLFDPRGKELRRKVVQTDAAGVITVDLPFADYASTGVYRVMAEVGERVVGETSFNVEEFVPERMKVTLSPVVAAGVRLGEPLELDVGARWLFGGSAAGSGVELSCRLESADFKPKSAEGWHFGLAQVDDTDQPRPITLGLVEGRLDEAGVARMSCPPPASSGAASGPLSLVADAAVFEGDSGRSTHVTARTPVHPERFYLGTRTATEKVKAGQRVSVQGLVADWEGKPSAEAPATVSVEILRLDEELGWWWDEREESSRYRRLLRRSRESVREVPVVKGVFTVDFTPAGSAAGYVVVVSSGAARSEQYIEGAARRYWWDPSDSEVDQTPRPKKPTPLVLELPALTKVGDRATVKTVAPYRGRMLFTVETDRVIEHSWKKVDAGPVEWSFRLDEFEPNVYVTAFLVKDPHLESMEAYLPDRAYGVASVPVEPTDFTAAVRLTIPAEMRPYSGLDVGIEVEPGAGPTTATVAVVDEGILQLTRFKSPNPHDSIFARRALGVESFETIGWTLLSEPGGTSAHSGGDAEGGGGRVQMVKPVALFSGPISVPASGKATVHFDIPGYRGQLRVMAVVAGKQRMGHAEATLLVRDPLVLQTTLPRFLVSGDIAELPVFVSNLSGGDREVTIQLEVEELPRKGGSSPGAKPSPVASIVGGSSGRLTLAEGQGGTVAFRLKALRAPGGLKLRVTATAPGGFSSKEELELPIAPAGMEERRTSRVALTSAHLDLGAALQAESWVPGSERSTYWITANPYADVLQHLDFVVHYPYGCIEQTSSGTRALLYVSRVVDAVDPSLVAEGSVDDMIRKGVERILSMQTPEGGFSYWPGDTTSSLWGTAYATATLLDAQKAGHPVPAGSLKDAVAYLEREVGNRESLDDAPTLAFGHYVVALAGKPQAARARSLHDKVLAQLKAPDRRSGWWWEDEMAGAAYLLEASVHLSGDRRYEAELRKLGAGHLRVRRANNWAFYSDLRDRSLRLAVFTELFGADKGGEAAAASIADSLRGHPSSSYTTQELAWALTALGKRLSEAASDIPSGSVTLDGRALTPSATTSWGEKSWLVHRGSEAGSLVLDVDRPSDKVFLVTSTQGVRPDSEVKVGGVGLRVERQWLDEKGQPLDLAKIALGDRVHVRLSLENTTPDRVQNVALVDRIPAGWEIENVNLGRGALPEWVDTDSLWSSDAYNQRDDRVEVFGSLEGRQTRSVVYVVRAVTSGTFTVPEVSAEAMYDPGVWARKAGITLNIAGPWAQFLL